MKQRTTALLFVLGGGLVGSAGRVVIAELVQRTEGGWPLSTLGVNLIGAFVLAAFLARRERAVSRPYAVELWAIGVLGSFTTFSALSFETFHLLDGGNGGIAAQYVLASTLGGVALAFMGDALGRRMA